MDSPVPKSGQMATTLLLIPYSNERINKMLNTAFNIRNYLIKRVTYPTNRKNLPIVLWAVFIYIQIVNKKRKFPIRNQEG